MVLGGRTMPYFIISNSDGQTSVEKVDKQTVLDRIKKEDGEECCYYGEVGFLSDIKDEDTNYWGENILIIKGEIIVPKEKKVIETYDIE